MLLRHPRPVPFAHNPTAHVNRLFGPPQFNNKNLTKINPFPRRMHLFQNNRFKSYFVMGM